MYNPDEKGETKGKDSLLGESQTGLIGAALASQLLPTVSGWAEYRERYGN